MKFFFFLIFLHVALFSATNIDKKIINREKMLKSKSAYERKLSKKLNDVARDILNEDKRLKSIIKRIDILGRSIAKNKNIVKDKEVNLKDLTSQNKTLNGRKKDLEKKIIKIIAEDFSFYLITNEEYQDSIDSILVSEVLEKMGVIVKKEFIKLSKDYNNINGKINIQNRQIENLKSSIKSLKNKKLELANLKKYKEVSIVKLDKERLLYKKRLYKIEKERRELRLTLKKLKIIKVAENAKKQKNLAKIRTKRDIKINGKLTVRQIGSSYQNSKVKRYRGKKTIAPLDSFIVKRKFGNYIDPIYNIKIFNESVILRAKRRNAKVRNVLNGKIIYAKNTALLDKVIIIENSYGIYTIYTHLSRIAPTIRVGKKVKKGYIIGRVEYDLYFEVTQKNYHINPLELIRY